MMLISFLGREAAGSVSDRYQELHPTTDNT